LSVGNHADDRIIKLPPEGAMKERLSDLREFVFAADEQAPCGVRPELNSARQTVHVAHRAQSAASPDGGGAHMDPDRAKAQQSP
jgi:hypothetical protein